MKGEATPDFRDFTNLGSLRRRMCDGVGEKKASGAMRHISGESTVGWARIVSCQGMSLSIVYGPTFSSGERRSNLVKNKLDFPPIIQYN